MRALTEYKVLQHTRPKALTAHRFLGSSRIHLRWYMVIFSYGRRASSDVHRGGDVVIAKSLCHHLINSKFIRLAQTSPSSLH